MTQGRAKTDHPFFLGIDGGGTRCRATVFDFELKALGSGEAGSANPFQGVEASISAIMAATKRAIANSNVEIDLDQIVAGLGIAGLNLPRMSEIFRGWEHHFLDAHISSDLCTARLGAHYGEDGAVIVVGTGSCGLAVEGAKTLELGGHGFPLGDKGGGAWLGYKAIRQYLYSIDNLAEHTLLDDILAEKMQERCALAIVEKYSHAKPVEFAKLAPAVHQAAAQHDPRAIQIVQEGANYIDAIHRYLDLPMMNGSFGDMAL